MVRSVLEYPSTVWDPHYRDDIKQIEMVQRRAARFVKNDYGSRSSVTQMMSDLNWKSLQDRRRDSRLVLLYKIINELVAIPPPPDKHLVKTTRNLKTANNQKQYHTIRATVDNFRFSFFPRKIREWNNLSDPVVSCPSVNAFRAAVQMI